MDVTWGGFNMPSKWRLLLPVFSVLMLASCSPVHESALNGHTSGNQGKILEVEQNIEDHPAWIDSPAEPVIGESAVEAPPAAE